MSRITCIDMDLCISSTWIKFGLYLHFSGCVGTKRASFLVNDMQTPPPPLQKLSNWNKRCVWLIIFTIYRGHTLSLDMVDFVLKSFYVRGALPSQTSRFSEGREKNGVTIGLNHPSLLVLGYHWFAFLNQVLGLQCKNIELNA